jgi:hypothetical protein
MNKEWLIRYYRSLGWDERRIAGFLDRSERGDIMKSKEVKRMLGVTK